MRLVPLVLSLHLLGLPSIVLAQVNGKFQLHFTDVGQGDGAVPFSPLGETVFFDNGVRNNCDKPVGYLEQLGDTPERVDRRKRVHPFPKQSLQFARWLIQRKTIRTGYGLPRTDRDEPLPVTVGAERVNHALALLKTRTANRGFTDSVDLHELLPLKWDSSQHRSTKIDLLVARLCLNSNWSTAAHAISGTTEPDAAQTLLALTLTVRNLQYRVGPCDGRRIAALIRLQAASAAIRYLQGSLSRDADDAHSRATRDFSAEPHARRLPQEDGVSIEAELGERMWWLAWSERQDLRQRLTALDLSWFAQLLAVALHLRDTAAGSDHIDWTALARQLQRAVSAQLEYVRVSFEHPEINYCY